MLPLSTILIGSECLVRLFLNCLVFWIPSGGAQCAIDALAFLAIVILTVLAIIWTRLAIV